MAAVIAIIIAVKIKLLDSAVMEGPCSPVIQLKFCQLLDSFNNSIFEVLYYVYDLKCHSG